MRALSSLAPFGLSALLCAQTTTPPDQVDPRRRFMIELPSGWRALAPDEARTLRERKAALPTDLLEPAPPQLLVFGAVDAWLRGEFDGRALVVAEKEGEPPIDAEGAGMVRNHFASLGATTVKVVETRAGTIGPDQHPALLGEFEWASGTWPGARFEAYAPTAGTTLVFSLGWPAADHAAGKSTFAKLIGSAKFARKPRGPTGLGSKLFWAALAGLAIGALLHTMRKRPRT